MVRLEGSLVEDNGDGSVARHGVEVHSGSELRMDHYAYNAVLGNAAHELYVAGSGRLYAGDAGYCEPDPDPPPDSFTAEGGAGGGVAESTSGPCEALDAGGYNDVYDASDPNNVAGHALYNASSYAVMAENNYWGGAPTSRTFYGDVSYVPYLPYSPTGGGGGGTLATASLAGSSYAGPSYATASGLSAPDPIASSDPIASTDPAVSGEASPDRPGRDWAALGRRIRALRAALREEAATGAGASLAAELYRLQRLDRADRLGEAAATRGLFEALRRDPRTSLADAPSGSPGRATAERLGLIALDEALHAGAYGEARAVLAEVGPYATSEAGRAEVAAARVALFEEAGEVEAALGALAEAEGLLDAGYVAVVAETLRDRLGEGDGARPEGVVSPAVSARGEGALPVEYALSPPYPNPSRGDVTVPFALPEAAEVRVAVYDLLGREVAVVAEGRYEAGRHEASLGASGLSAGVYVVHARVGAPGGGAYAFTRKLTLIK